MRSFRIRRARFTLKIAALSTVALFGIGLAPTSAFASPVTPFKGEVYYANCDAVRAAGAAPLYRGQPGYRAGLDRDGDGVACESGGSSSPFTDVPITHRFHNEIEWMKSAGLTTGYADGSYRPSDGLSREAMAAFLYRQAGSPAPGTAPAFTDVPPSHKFYRAITWMRSSGLTTGYADGSYRPSDGLSREAMAAFLYRQAGSPTPGTAPAFTDVPPSHKFYRAITWMRSSGLTTGYADGSYRPSDGLSREAMAAFLYRKSH
jgi:hypothetical protein